MPPTTHSSPAERGPGMRMWAVGAMFALGLAGVSAPAAAQQRHIPREPPPDPGTRSLTVEGWWGYPCLTQHVGCLIHDPDVDWVPLEVAAWIGGDRFIGGFTSFEGDRFQLEVTLEVPPQRRGDLVMLEVRAQAPEGHTARFTQVVDVAYRLLAEAGPDGRVPHADARPKMLSIMTTALTGLLEEANGGDWRMDEARLHELLPQIDPQRVMRHAMAFEGLVSGTLPGAGSIDPNALVASSQAVDAYLGGVPEATLEAVFDRFQQRGWSAYQPIELQALDATLVPRSAPGTLAFGRREGIRMRMRDSWETGGFSTVIDTGLVRGLTTHFMSHIDSFPRALRIVRSGQPSFESQVFVFDCPGEGEIDVIRITARSPDMLRRMAMLGGLEFVEYSEQRLLAYAPVEGDDPACLDELPGFEYSRSYRLAYPLLGRGRAYVSMFQGPVAVQLLNPDPDPLHEDSQFIAGTLDLSTGAVDAPGYAASGRVRRDASGVAMLEVDTLPGTLREGEVRMRLEALRGDGIGAQEWVLSSRVLGTGDDHVRAHVSPVVRVDRDLGLDAEGLDGAWRSGSDLSVPGALDATTIAFNAVSGQGTLQAPGGATVPFSWLMQDGRMQAGTFALDAQPGVLLPACPPGATDCREVLRRVWTPLRLGVRGDLQRLYVIEELHVDDGDGLKLRSRGLNYYDAW